MFDVVSELWFLSSVHVIGIVVIVILYLFDLMYTLKSS
jgi:hypothetical protein